MGQTPDDIKQQMSQTRSDAEKTMDALKDSATSTVSGAKQSLASTVDDLGTKAGNVTQQLADNAPSVENAMPLVIACAIVGFAAGFAAPLTSFERERLGPVGTEISRRLKNTRAEIVDQSKAVVQETTAAAKASLDKHGKEAAEHLGV